jgi:hypothetical protein
MAGPIEMYRAAAAAGDFDRRPVYYCDAAGSEAVLYGSVSWNTAGGPDFMFAGMRLVAVNERPEGALDVPGAKVERVEPRGWKCEACGGSGQSSNPGIDPFEPDWHSQWWLALREWTTAGKEPDPDAMADILRGLGYERRPTDNPWMRVVYKANGPVLERITDYAGPTSVTVSLGDANEPDDEDNPSVTLQAASAELARLLEQVDQARRRSAAEFLRQYNGDWLPPEEPTRFAVGDWMTLDHAALGFVPGPADEEPTR